MTASSRLFISHERHICTGQCSLAAGLSLVANLQIHTYSLPRQMSEAGLEARLRQAEAAVVKAQAAYDTALDGSKTLCGQLLLAKEKALEQLMEEKLIQQRAATGDTQAEFLHMTCRSSD